MFSPEIILMAVKSKCKIPMLFSHYPQQPFASWKEYASSHNSTFKLMEILFCSLFHNIRVGPTKLLVL